MPFTISWKPTMMAYAVQNARRRSSRVRNTARSSTTVATTAMAVAAV